MRRQSDLVLIHPPSVFDFRDRTIFYGPVSDVIPSSPVFEMYPIGFLTMAAYLRRHGYRVRIINLALLMMRSRRFDPEQVLRNVRPKLFGIDLHWLPHAHGGPAVAALLKRLHPDIPIVFGGISATYFHRELIEDPSVDFVLRGSVTEPSLLSLMQQLVGEKDFARVPGLTWKGAPVGGQAPRLSGEPEDEPSSSIRVNPPACLPPTLDEFDVDAGMLIRDVVGHLDFWSTVPFHAFWRHPITAVFTVRGCLHRCVTCGASGSAFERFMPGRYPLLRSPQRIAKMVSELASFSRAPIFIVGDLRDGGERYANDVLDALSGRRVSNRIIFEFFSPPSRDFIARIAGAVNSWGGELSPESHDEAIRARLGKAQYTNEEMLESIEAMLAARCEQLDLFYMIGLPLQTWRSVMETVDAIEWIFQRTDRRVSAFITPMGPFIDPGSDGFELAESRGYRIRARTLAEHRTLLEQRDWESILNYETEWMTRKEIVDATYDAAERLNRLKARYGRISQKVAHAVDERLQKARAIRRELAANRIPVGDIREFSEGTINDKGELFPPSAFLRNFRLTGIIKLMWSAGASSAHCAPAFVR